MLKKLQKRVEEYNEHVSVRPVGERLEPALVALARSGLPTQPTQLDLSGARWGGEPAPGVSTLTVHDDGTLHHEAQPRTRDALVSDPSKWTRTVFQADVAEHGSLMIESGGSDILQATYGSEGSTITAVLNGWRWSATTGDAPTIWAAPLDFWTPNPPIPLWWPGGNACLVVDERLVRCWRFDTKGGLVFLIPSGGRWYLAIEARTAEGPDGAHIHLVRSVLGFAFGEPLNVGIFRPMGGEGVRPGLVHLGLLRHRGQRASRQPPALRFDCAPTWTARFVEGLVQLAVDDPSAPVLSAVHLYFAALSGFIESNFLHVWIATEIVAKWGIEAGRFPDGGRRRLANHDAWIEWVKQTGPASRLSQLQG